MKSKELVREWFEKWEVGNFLNLPITDKFKHTSPYGIINGKKQYIDLVDANRDKFLGHIFKIHDEFYNKERACVRYTTSQDDFVLEVSEWYFFKNNLIDEIISYYNIEGEINEERKLSKP